MIALPLDDHLLLRVRSNARLALHWVSDARVVEAYVAEVMVALGQYRSLRRRVRSHDGRVEVFLASGELTAGDIQRDLRALFRAEALLREIGLDDWGG